MYADTVDDIHAALKKLKAPIFIDNDGRLVWKPKKGPLLRLRARRQLMYFLGVLGVRFEKRKHGKWVLADPPGQALSLFMELAAQYCWFPDLEKEDE